MRIPASVSPHLRDTCLTAEAIGRYASGSMGPEDLSKVERHLTGCSGCRQELAEVVQLLNPDQNLGDEIPALSSAEIDETLSLIRGVSREEGERKGRYARRLRWAGLAAAASLLLAAGAWALKYYSDLGRSEYFLAQAKTKLEEVYSGSSPSGLRLDLPFHSTATTRGSAPEDALGSAENLFYQALAVREGSLEARLGLGSVYLGKSQFSKARSEFQAVLDATASDTRALIARGVTGYEEALRAEDPVRRDLLLKNALADFDAVLSRDTNSVVARYDRIWVLFERGRHEEALREMDLYLATDSRSIWAARLRDLKTRIGMNRPEDVDRAVEKAAAGRDAGSLSSLVRLARSETPGAIRQALAQSLKMEDSTATSKRPDSGDLRWAAAVMELEYSAATGDRSYRKLLEFYDGLSPPERKLKLTLDTRFQELVSFYRKGESKRALEGCRPLESEFSHLQDHWQLLNLLHLRGNCLYYLAAFKKSEMEYRRMLSVAESLGATDLVAKALAALSSALTEQRRFDDALAYNGRLKKLAEAHGDDFWRAFASRKLGSTYLLLNRFQESQVEYSEALRFAYRHRQAELLIQILEDLGLIMERMGRPEDAHALYQEALLQLDLFQKQGALVLRLETAARRANLLIKSAELKLGAGDTAAAEAVLNEALASAPAEMQELSGRIRLSLAQVYLSEGRLDEAESLIGGTLKTALAGNYAESAWQAGFLKGLLLERRGQSGPAIDALEHAVGVLEQVQKGAPPGKLRQSFIVGRLEPYRELVSLLYHHAGDTPRAMTWVDRAKSTALRDYLESHDLHPRFIDSTSRRNKRPVRQVMPPDHVGLEYFFSSRELFVFVTGRGESRAIALPVTQAEISGQVRRYRRSAVNADERAFSELSRQLYDELVGPALDRMSPEADSTLVIFPDGPLHELPFAGLRDAQDRFLLEKHAIAYAPSAGILSRCLSLNRGDAGSLERSVVLLDGSDNLRNARDELAGLDRLYGRNARFLSAAELSAAGSGTLISEILHFAGHSVVRDGNPCLVVHAGSGETALDPETISTWRLRANRLVNLSGCETGTGPQAGGGTPWGLVPAFLNAGAPALVVSLLPVTDSSTRKMNARFYELLSGGSVSKASALRQAQLSILSSERSTGRVNPASWIPYVLVGDPR